MGQDNKMSEQMLEDKLLYRIDELKKLIVRKEFPGRKLHLLGEQLNEMIKLIRESKEKKDGNSKRDNKGIGKVSAKRTNSSSDT